MMKNKILIYGIITGLVLVISTIFIWNNYQIQFTERPDKPIKLPPQLSGECGIENCHGLDIVCGPNPAEMCTMMYQLGDSCRQFAQCGVVNGACQQIKNTQFTVCKACVEKCEKDYPSDPDKAFDCESRCAE